MAATKTTRRKPKRRKASNNGLDKRSSPRGPTSAPTRGKGTRGGQRLAEAFEAVEQVPVVGESKRRLRRILGKPSPSADAVTETVESDVGLVIAVLHAASERDEGLGRVWGVADAVDLVTPAGVGAAADEVEEYELVDPPPSWNGRLDSLRRHSVATRHAAVRVAELGGHANWEELALAAMLHDIGQLVLGRLYPGYGELADSRMAIPEERIQAERRELGIDHALVGGVLTRRWGLPQTITSTIERHHATDLSGSAAVIALADQIAHHSHGNPVSMERVSQLSDHAGLDRERLDGLLYEFPHSHTPKRRAPEPCPLSGRELDALRGLAEGKVYKEIADDLSLSASTVRTHLHNVYRKLGAIDRAQAVLIARDRGWI